MTNRVTPQLIRESARNLRRTRFTPKRSQALAPEVERLNAAALAASEANDFNEEPASFAVTLLRLKAKGTQP